MASWFSYVNVAAAALAGAVWYLFPQLGPWPLAVGLAPWIVRFVKTGRAGRLTRFAPPLFLFLASAAGGVWAAYDQPSAWAKFWLIVGGILLFYAFAHGLLAASEGAGERGEAYAWLLAVFGAAVTLYFLLTHDWDQFAVELTFVRDLGRRLQAPLPPLPGHRLNPNVVGGLLAMSAPFAGVLFCLEWERRRWWPMASALLLLALALFGLLMTTSRGAWAGLLVALALAGVWTLAGWGGWIRPSRRRWLVLGVSLAAVLLGVGAVVLRPETVAAALGPLPGAGGIGRLAMYRSALPLVTDYPFVGAGLNGFAMLYSTYAFLTHVGFIPHAHNIYLNVAVEQGLPALVALGWMWWLSAAAGWREAAGGRVRPLLAAGLLSLVTVAVHGLVDDAFYGSRALLLLFVPMAFVLPFPRAQEVGWWPKRALLAKAGLLLLATVLLWHPFLSLVYSNLAAIQQSRAELSVYRWPEWPIQDAVRREIDLGEPAANFKRALELNPQSAAANRRLGQIELSLGAYEAALHHLQAAYGEMPWNNGTRQLYGEALIVTGSVEKGARLWSGVWTGQGQLAARIFWYQHIGDQERLEAVQAAARRAHDG